MSEPEPGIKFMPTGTKKEYLWKPFAKQIRALTCPAFEMGFGGAPGGGKSDVMIMKPLQQIQHEGFKALILRRKYIDLERSLIVRSQELYRGRGKWDGQHKRWNFANECSVEFGHCQRPGDIYNYQSAQYHFIGIEQLEQFTEEMYRFFFSRIRNARNPNIKPKIWSNFNPGGIGHTWIKKRFFIGQRKPDELWKITETLKRPDGQEEVFTYLRAFIPSLVYDNDFLMKNDRQYLMRLMQLPEPKRTAYLEGRFDLFEGQFFGEWDPTLHVIDPFEIPPNWKRSIAFDWGYAKPMAMLWFAEDPKSGTVYVYRELYITKTDDIEVARKMAEYSAGEAIDTIYYPWDLDTPNPQTNVSMHERMDTATGGRFYWRKAIKDRKNGWSAVRYLLSKRPGGVRLQIFKNCANLIRTIPEQIYDETDSEDLDTLGEDHAVDALRYYAATYRTPEEMRADISRAQMPIDLGGAILMPSGERRFKKETNQAVHFNWMTE